MSVNRMIKTVGDNDELNTARFNCWLQSDHPLRR